MYADRNRLRRMYVIYILMTTSFAFQVMFHLLWMQISYGKNINKMFRSREFSLLLFKKENVVNFYMYYDFESIIIIIIIIFVCV